MELLRLEVRKGQQRPVEALASLGQELRDREDLRMELLRLEVRKAQQRPVEALASLGQELRVGRTSGWSCSC